MLVSYLNQKGIDFTERRVDDDEIARNAMTEASGGFLGVPFTVIEKDGQTHKIIGFDKNKLDSIL
jgi:glutaredoxin